MDKWRGAKDALSGDFKLKNHSNLLGNKNELHLLLFSDENHNNFQISNEMKLLVSMKCSYTVNLKNGNICKNSERNKK